MTESSEPVVRPWWGTWKMQPGEVRRWQVGPFALWVERRTYEWRLGASQGTDPLEDRREVAVAASAAEIEYADRIERFVHRRSAGTLCLSPILADRDIVTRPATPFRILPGEDVQLYVSSPVWVRLEVEPPRQPLLELPTFRPSDTWFGPNTWEGKLCYASRTHCRLELEDLPHRPHRAVTPVLISNRGADSLLLERLSVPVGLLSLFFGQDGHLWTQAIGIRRELDSDVLAQVEIVPGPPPQARGADPVCGPRTRREGNVLAEALSALLSS